MRSPHSTAVALLTFALLSSTALAQSPAPKDGDSPRQRMESIRKRVDTNNDGSIQPKEARAAREAFQKRGGIEGLPDSVKAKLKERADANQDGRISDEEKAAFRRGLGQRHGQRMGSGPRKAPNPEGSPEGRRPSPRSEQGKQLQKGNRRMGPIQRSAQGRAPGMGAPPQLRGQRGTETLRRLRQRIPERMRRQVSKRIPREMLKRMRSRMQQAKPPGADRRSGAHARKFRPEGKEQRGQAPRGHAQRKPGGHGESGGKAPGHGQCRGLRGEGDCARQGKSEGRGRPPGRNR